MKRTKIYISLLLILALMFVIHSQMNNPVTEIETKMTIQQEETELVAPVIEVEEPEAVVETVPVQTVEVEEVVPENTAEELNTEIATEVPEALEIKVVEAEDLDIPESEEEGVRIVKISFCDPESEPGIVMEPTYELAHAKGFRIYGNYDETPLNLIVKSCDSDDCVDIYYLDWDARHPNEYSLADCLGCKAEVSVYKAEVQVAQFTLSSPIDEEYIALDLNEPVRLALAH